MKKMLVTTRQALIWFCACPSDESTWKKLVHGLVFLVNLLLSMCLLATLLTWCFEFGSANHGDLLAAFMYICGTAIKIYASIVCFFRRHQMAEIFKNLSQIHDMGN